ncbi:MAG: hypothetical protein F6K22_12335 [Okeania sp. SIO2F4]|uniref:hypothetical protein n=1 Tax=Okeania sp. SIO2F4 TaxID=2607790 RepID=UPI001429345F|nr:hypothetical protein [Okeania sp. SIO2F4]NES03561.1 hypothetical protein [Okeania sp. SIO2F4]
MSSGESLEITFARFRAASGEIGLEIVNKSNSSPGNVFSFYPANLIISSVSICID